MADRVALYLQDDYSTQESIEIVKYAEAAGFETVWQAESRLSRDSVVMAAAYATTTRRIDVATGVMNIWTRHPALIASLFLTLDDIAPHRMICGLGTWFDPLATQLGIDRSKHLLVMREVVTTIRRLLNMERVSFDGQHVSMQDVSLDSSGIRREPRRVPIYIGATGAKLLALAGEIADGVLLNYMTTPAYTEMAVAQLQPGLKLAGRTVYDIDRPQLIACSVHVDRQIALNSARRFVAQFIMQQPAVLRTIGLAPTLVDELLRLLATQPRIDAIMPLITDDVVQQLTASGTPEEVRRKVHAFMYAGATHPVLYPISDNARLVIDTFANGYSQ